MNTDTIFYFLLYFTGIDAIDVRRFSRLCHCGTGHGSPHSRQFVNSLAADSSSWDLTTMLSATRRSLLSSARSGSLPRAQTAAISSLSTVKSPLVIHRSSCPSPAPALHRATLVHYRNMSKESAARPEPDKVLKDIADYIHNYEITSDLAFETARLCLIDTIGCGLEGLQFPACARLMGPVVEGTIVPNGA